MTLPARTARALAVLVLVFGAIAAWNTAPTPASAAEPLQSIVPVPVNADSSYGMGEQRLSLQQAYADGGPDGLTAAVEGLLSMSLDFTAVGDPAKAAVRHPRA